MSTKRAALKTFDPHAKRFNQEQSMSDHELEDLFMCKPCHGEGILFVGERRDLQVVECWLCDGTGFKPTKRILAGSLDSQTILNEPQALTSALRRAWSRH